MSNYVMKIEYDGTRYKGWQRNKNADQTIQGKIEAVLSKMTGEEIEIHGSGRTDAGVHAKGQVANFHTKQNYEPTWVRAYLNQYLPDDIAVRSVQLMDDRFHSRLSATGKTYLYRIHTSDIPDVFERKYVYTMAETFDVAAMRQAAEYLCGTHDFKCFCGNPKMKKSTIRTITKIEISEGEEELRFEITGNGFLQNMVRILVGTLVEVGLGKRKSEEMCQILESRDREQAGMTMPAQGLTLLEVYYAK